MTWRTLQESLFHDMRRMSICFTCFRKKLWSDLKLHNQTSMGMSPAALKLRAVGRNERWHRQARMAVRIWHWCGTSLVAKRCPRGTTSGGMVGTTFRGAQAEHDKASDGKSGSSRGWWAWWRGGRRSTKAGKTGSSWGWWRAGRWRAGRWSTKASGGKTGSSRGRRARWRAGSEAKIEEEPLPQRSSTSLRESSGPHEVEVLHHRSTVLTLARPVWGLKWESECAWHH